MTTTDRTTDPATDRPQTEPPPAEAPVTTLASPSATLATSVDPDWNKPGPGAWQLDKSHFDADCSRVVRDVIEAGMTQGMADGFELMGGPMQGMEAKFVNGRFYIRLVPLVAPDRDLPQPPAPILWLATRLHPAFRRRNRIARRAFADRFWIGEHRRWETTWKPELVATNSAFSAMAPEKMSDADLAVHVDELFTHLVASATLHFRLHVSDMGPIGLLLVRARKWGFDDRDTMAMLAGSSPATSAPARALEELRDLVADTSPAPSTLDQVREVSPAAAAALDGYLLEFGDRLTTGYDIQELTLAELPQLILAGINAEAGTSRIGTNRTHRQIGPDGTETETETGWSIEQRLRERVPPESRAQFDVTVADARALYGLRDENGPLTYEWPAGLMRRSLVEAGGRLTDRGRLDRTDHVFDLTAAEVAGLLRDKPTPTRQSAAGRYAARQTWKALSAPDWLGDPPPDPPLWVMPGPLATELEVIFALLPLLEAEPAEPMEGLGIGNTIHRGIARVIADAADGADRVQPGDIVVTTHTVPTFNAVLAIAGAVVTEEGGLLCHAAVIAREFAIPGIVGVAAATTDIPDGAFIEVDPTAGTVRIID